MDSDFSIRKSSVIEVNVEDVLGCTDIEACNYNDIVLMIRTSFDLGCTCVIRY